MPSWLTEIDWVLGLRSEALTVFFSTITHLGGMGFAFIFLGFCTFLWRRDVFGRLILVSLLSELANVHLKAAYQAPRPDPFFHLVEAAGWSFPSGHAQQATALWMWLAVELETTWAWLTGSLLVIAVASSRVYLGVHTVRDVAGGLLLGLFMLLYFRWLLRQEARRPPKLPTLLGLLSVFQILWLPLAPEGATGYAFLPAALFAGFLGGMAAQGRLPVGAQRARRLSVLLTVPLAVFGLLAHVASPERWWGPFGLGTHPASVFIQFALLGIWASWAAPLLKGGLTKEVSITGSS